MGVLTKILSIIGGNNVGGISTAILDEDGLAILDENGSPLLEE